jgi:hypothetical protein
MLNAMFCVAQNVSHDFEVKMGHAFEGDNLFNSFEIKLIDNYTLSTKFRKEKVLIQKFNTITLKEDFRVEYSNFPKGFTPQKLVCTKSGIYFFYEVKNRKLKNHTLYVREINSSNGLMKQERALLTSSATVVPSIAINAQVTNGNGNLNNVSNISRLSISPIEYNNGTSKIIPRFEIIESNDNSKIVVKYRLKPEKMSKNKSIDKLGFYVFNQTIE